MNQKYTGILVVVLFAAAAFIGGYMWRGGDDAVVVPTPLASEAPSKYTGATDVPLVNASPQLHTVSLTQSGPTPKTLTVRVGDAVSFRNTAAFAYWPASDPHPSHTQCPWLDAGRGLKTGEEYTVVFTTAATCTYHSHLDPSNDALRGTIVAR